MSIEKLCMSNKKEQQNQTFRYRPADQKFLYSAVPSGLAVGEGSALALTSGVSFGAGSTINVNLPALIILFSTMVAPGSKVTST